MPRNLSTAMQAALAAGAVFPAWLVQIGFRSETLYIWSGLGSLTWNGNTYSGVGSMLGFTDDKGNGTIEEGSSVEARGIAITLSGFDPTALAEFVGDYQVGNPVAVYLGLFTDATRSTLIDDPVCVWAGETDQPTFDYPGGTVSMACENVLNEMNVAVDRRRTLADMQELTLGDLGFQFVASLGNRTIYWGTVPSNRGANTP